MGCFVYKRGTVYSWDTCTAHALYTFSEKTWFGILIYNFSFVLVVVCLVFVFAFVFLNGFSYLTVRSALVHMCSVVSVRVWRLLHSSFKVSAQNIPNHFILNLLKRKEVPLERMRSGSFSN